MTWTLDPVTREDIEAELWRWSEWRADQRGVDAVLSRVDQYKLTVSDVTASVDQLLAQARNEAAQIVQSAKEEAAAVAPPPALCLGCQAAINEAIAKREARQGKRLRVPETDRKCSCCARVKGIDRFNRDVKARNGRKPQCKECEAVQRADRRTVAKAKAEGKRALSVKVQP